MTLYRYYQSPVGTLLLLGDGRVLEQLLLPNKASRFQADSGQREDGDGFEEVVSQLDEYFCGKRTIFNLEIKTCGTAFQRRVWKELQKVPFGATASYGEIAARIGNSRASRAVGLANGRNPIPIIIPCHRIIGSDGSLTGFGGGLELKKRLLAHESAVTAQQGFDASHRYR